jgi:factor associated with neutral sphingomyelinase activation
LGQALANAKQIWDRRLKGRIKLCSGSILFDPEDTRYAILKFPYESVVGCGKWNGPLTELLPDKKETFIIRSESVVMMKENNQNRPYVFQKVGHILPTFQKVPRLIFV